MHTVAALQSTLTEWLHRSNRINVQESTMVYELNQIILPLSVQLSNVVQVLFESPV